MTLGPLAAGSAQGAVAVGQPLAKREGQHLVEGDSLQPPAQGCRGRDRATIKGPEAFEI